jgi:hypothetical protein
MSLETKYYNCFHQFAKIIGVQLKKDEMILKPFKIVRLMKKIWPKNRFAFHLFSWKSFFLLGWNEIFNDLDPCQVMKKTSKASKNFCVFRRQRFILEI